MMIITANSGNIMQNAYLHIISKPQAYVAVLCIAHPLL